MTPDRHARIAEVFAAARRVEGAARTRLLAEQCGQDADLRSEVEALLDHHAAPRVNLDQPALDQLPSSLQAELPDAARDRTLTPPPIPGFDLGPQIGAGGMGIVYRATQQQPRRDVALKLVRPGFAHQHALRRFEQEAAILARLEHPAIARLYAFGVADATGRAQPYFAMEYVDGSDLRTHLRTRQPSRDALLDLFVRIAEAVHFAHTRGVLHRDLKPGNILVSANGRPKILDFGIGKLLDEPVDDSANITLTGQVLGTPAYMSPEQAGGALEQVDTRSDVYSLGVVLFEMLSGQLPHPVADKPFAQALRMIAEQPPATLRSTGDFERDLELIAGKALEHEPARRYQSAAALADDITRFRRHEPIAARRPTLGYQLARLARRHRPAFVAAGVALAALLIGAVGLTWGLVDATRARGLAEQRLQRAEKAERLSAERLVESEAARTESERQAAITSAVNAFFNEDLLRQLDPAVGRHDITLREAIDAARDRLADRFADEPLVRASILYTLGDAYVTLARYDEAETLLIEALELRRAALSPVHDDVMAAESALVLVYSDRGETDRAIEMNEQMLAARLEAFGPESPESLAMMNNLAMLHMDQGDLERALPLSERVCTTMQRVAPDNPETLATMINLALLYKRVDRLADAETLLTDCNDFARRVLPDDHPYFGYIWNHLGTLYLLQARPTDAAAEFERVVDLRTRLVGDRHPGTLTGRTNLATALTTLGEFDQAERIFLDAIEIRSEELGPRHATVLASQHNLARLYREAGDPTAARRLTERVLQARTEDLGPDHPDTLLTAGLHGGVLADAGERDAAIVLLTETLAAQDETLGPRHTETVSTRSELARAYLAADQPESAREVAADALRELTRGPHPRVDLHVALLVTLGRAQCALGAIDDGAARLRQAAALCQASPDAAGCAALRSEVDLCP